MKTITNMIGMLVCVIACSSVLTTNAQISMGVKAGANVATMKFAGAGDDGGEVKSITGLNFGVPVEFRFAKVVAMQVEINYLQKGMHYTYEERYYDGKEMQKRSMDTKFILDYVEIPLLIKLGINEKDFGINFLAGPSFGRSTKFSVSTNGETTTITSKDEGFYAWTDFGLNVGMEISVKSGPGTLYWEARYQTATIINEYTFWGFTMRNTGIQAVLGYRIPLTTKKK